MANNDIQKQLEALGLKLPTPTPGPTTGAPAASGGVTVDFNKYLSQNPGTSIGNNAPTIPLFRHVYGSKGSAGSANAAEYHATENSTQTQFDQETANGQFATLLMDKNLLAKWQALVVKAGILTPAEATDAVKLEAAWKTAVGWAINMKAASKGKTELTPFEALEAVAQNTGASALAAQAYAQDHFTGTKTVTSKSTDTTYGAQQGEALRQLLGRTPTASEEAAYKRGLADYATHNPTVQRQSTTFQNGEAVLVDSNTSGGYDQNAAEYASAASATPEVAIQQQSSTYYDALVKALQAAA